MNDLQGKLALVTGGTKNIGRAIVGELAAQGAHVIVNFFHSLEAAKQMQQELKSQGIRIDIIRASVAQPAQVERMFKEIEEKYGYLDILVNNAASGALVPVEEVTEEYLDRALTTNFKGSFWCSRKAAALMQKRGSGSIINISALGSSQMVMANYLACGPAKAAIEALTRYLAVEYAPYNIRVNTASGGMIVSEVANSSPRADEMQQVIGNATPMGRLGTLQDFANVVAFLASERSCWITGQAILADGGLSLGSALLSPPDLRTGRMAELFSQANLSLNGSHVQQDHVEAPTSQETRSMPPSDNEQNGDEIAIVGMGLTVAGANNPEEFWRVMVDGPDLFTQQVPEKRWDNSLFYASDTQAEDKTYQRTFAFITDFKLTPRLQQEIGNNQDEHEFTTLWLRHSLLQALEGVKTRSDDSFALIVGYTPDGSQHLEEACVLAGTMHRIEQSLAQLDNTSPSEKKALLEEIKATLTRHYWRSSQNPARFLPYEVCRRTMKGALPETTKLQIVDTACSSSLYAIDIGFKDLLAGKHDIAICGGALAVGPRGSILFAKLHGLSMRGEVRALDKDSDGVLFSDGAGVVVLKKLRRAIQDGDRILAVLKAFGSSSDGKGKAIYAPSSEGQALAIQRALSKPGVNLENLDWIVAHGTGTPAGDSAEFTTLRETINTKHPVQVTSNKSLVGHTGWAAGVVSLIEVVLGLQNSLIPPQFRFTAPPESFEIETCSLQIPTTALPWPSNNQHTRMASISSFGFGGTNAHLMVEEYKSSKSVSSPVPKQFRTNERIVIVGWATHLPELSSKEDVENWLRGTGRGPARSFGTFYPTPSFQRVRLPRSTVRSIDRCQLMILECAHELHDHLKDFWDIHRHKTGVFIGHMGSTRAGILYANRCHLDEIKHTLNSNPRLAHSPLVQRALEETEQDIKGQIPPCNEDSSPGIMPNIIPARVANYFDLRGPNIAIDTGFASALTAFEIASLYLRTGEVELALVGGINGNTTPEMTFLLRDLLASSTQELAEGACLFSLTTETMALQAGLPILGYVDDFSINSQITTQPLATNHNRCGYLAAEGALAVLTALLQPSGQKVIRCKAGKDAPIAVLTISTPGETDRQDPEKHLLPAQFLHSTEYAPGQSRVVKRHVPVLKELAVEKVRSAIPFLLPNCLVLTDQPVLLSEMGELPEELAMLSLAKLHIPPGKNRIFLPEVTPDTVRQAFAQLGQRFEHVRVVTNLSQTAPAPDCLADEPKELIALHDLCFLVLQQHFEHLNKEQSSFIALFLETLANGQQHPFIGLFGGLLKCAQLELPKSVIYGLFTSTRNIQEAVQQAQSESAAHRYLPVVIYEQGSRKTTFLQEAEQELPKDTAVQLDRHSVVLAIGGARGITAEILKAVAQHFRPRLYLLGSNPLHSYIEEVFTGSDEEFAKTRPAYLREQRAQHPGQSLATINKSFDRLIEARTARKNMSDMKKYSGNAHVHYICCDVTEREKLAQIVAEILEKEGKIDLLINAAGLNRSALIPDKHFAEFRRIRDLKIRAYQNLKYAFKDYQPRLWCNFGSLIGLSGQLGEADYSSANDFLMSASTYANHLSTNEEFTLAWTFWSSVGLAANPLAKAYFEKEGAYSNMTTEEGIYHFIREIHLSPHVQATIHVGEPEKKVINTYILGFFQEQAQKAPTATFYLDRVLSQQKNEMVFERTFDLQRDSYLNHHRVNGYATLPGTFVTEIAGEAASQLVPGMHVIAYEDIQFQHFLRVYNAGHPSLKRIHASIVEHTAEQVVVLVRILMDIIAPNGRIIKKDKMHFETKVILRNDFPPAPYWQTWDDTEKTPVLDPYHVPDSPVLLTDMFVSTEDTRLHPLGKRARYSLQLPADHPVFSRFMMPTILLDGLARVGVLNFVADKYIQLFAPISIRRLDVYEQINDCQVAQKYGKIELYATPREFTLQPQDEYNRLVAVRPDGKMLVQIKDMVGTPVGYIHAETKKFFTLEQFSSLVQEDASTVQ